MVAHDTVCALGHILPTVLLIGAQKAGTTSLFSDMRKTMIGATGSRTLDGEPAMYHKEKHFFDQHHSNGLAHYVAHYPPCPAVGSTPVLFAMDATPNYMKHKLAATRARASYVQAHAAKQVRIIALLRSPTERVRSWYDHIGKEFAHAKLGLNVWVRESLRRMRSCAAQHNLSVSSGELWGSKCNNLGHSFGDALVGGMYAPQLAAWLRAFSARQLAVVTLSGYLRQTDRVLADLAHFIGHPMHAKPGTRGVTHHARELATIGAADALGAGSGSRIRRLLLQAAHLNTRGRVKSTLGAAERSALDAFYRPHVHELVRFFREPTSRAITSTPHSPITRLTATVLTAS